MTAIFPSTLGAATGHYTHAQGVPAAEWSVVHGLGFAPTVQAFDSAGDEVEGDVRHDSLERLTLTFSAPFAGVAYCN